MATTAWWHLLCGGQTPWWQHGPLHHSEHKWLLPKQGNHHVHFTLAVTYMDRITHSAIRDFGMYSNRSSWHISCLCRNKVAFSWTLMVKRGLSNNQFWVCPIFERPSSSANVTVESLYISVISYGIEFKLCVIVFAWSHGYAHTAVFDFGMYSREIRNVD